MTPPENSEQKSPPEIDPTIVALGGEEIPVTFQSGSTDRIKVRILTIEHFPRYIDLALMDNELAEYVCAQAQGWAATLDADSLQDIIEKADALNLARALRWFSRRASVIERLRPLSERAKTLKKSGS